MGVQEPVEDAFAEVPASPPGVQDLGSDDDLFAQVNDDKPPGITPRNYLFKGILPDLPYKGNFAFFGEQDEKNIWGLQKLSNKNNNKYCPTCSEDVTRDLKRLEKLAQERKIEADDLRAENVSLKKELEELKKHLKKNESDTDPEVKITIPQKNEDEFEVLVRKRNNENKICQNNISDILPSKKHHPELENNYGVKSFSISLPKENIRYPLKNEDKNKFESKSSKSVTELRKEFFEKAFQSEQKTFTSRNYLKIEPEEKKNTFRSRLTIKIEPKPRIAEVISKLTSLNSTSKLVPQATPISMFQSFEKTRIVWQNEFSVLRREANNLSG